MRKGYFAWILGSLMTLGFTMLVALMPVRATEAPAADGVVLVLSNVRFSTLVTELSRQTKLNIVLQKDVDTELAAVNYPTPTPVETILANVSRSVGLDYWKDGDTYVIGKRQAIVAVPATVDPIPSAPKFPKISTPAVTPPSTGGNTGFTATATPIPDNNSASYEKPQVIRKLELRHTNVVELLWALGEQGAHIGSQPRERMMKQRIQTVLGDRKRFSVDGTANEASTSSTPWYDNYINSRYNRNGLTNANQIINRPPTGGGRPGGTAPGGTGVGGTRPAGAPGTGTAGTPDDPTQVKSKLTEGPLSSFIPQGVYDVVGLIGLNSLLVRADSEEAIDQLDQLIKLLDQPVKQVIVEVMFVKMEVKDAFSLGVSWEYAGMPISVVSSNGGGEGNFAIRYIKGSLKVALATLLTTSRAKVVNAPRVIVPNNGGGSVTISDSIPFVMVQEETDVFGRTVQNPQIEMQTFDQGLTVNNVTIHPDETITLDLFPELSAPGAGVGIPGGAGEVSSESTFDVETIVRVKNGETVMMGGFVSKNEAAGGTRAPLLSDLPVLGPLLFKNKTHSVSNTETLVFVTPTIMKEDTTDFGGMATLPPLF